MIVTTYLKEIRKKPEMKTTRGSIKGQTSSGNYSGRDRSNLTWSMGGITAFMILFALLLVVCNNDTERRIN
jgi:hypothetical protein